MKKLYLLSLGCTKNLVDTEVMLGRLQEMELTERVEEADVIIVNTCGFIEAAKRESIQQILELHQQRKEESLLVVAGCLSERYKEELQRELPEVDLFTGVGDYARIDELIAKRESRFSPEVYLIHQEERRITGSTYHAYIKLSEGCNQRCSFCAIPSFKGRLRSRPLSLVVQEVQRLVDQGFRDFTFISQDSSSYLRDHGEREGLIKLIEAVEAIDGVESGRILYLYPATTSFDLIDRIAASPIFANYFDIPLQHICDSMLQRMRRGLDASRTLELLERMEAIPDRFIRTAFIIGHPGEGWREFQELVEFIKSFPFDRITLFGYSPEEGTSAFAMEDQVPPSTIEERLQELQPIVDQKHRASLEALVGRELIAYLDGVSQESELLLSGRDWRWAPQIDGEILINESALNHLVPGERYKVFIDEVVGEQLLGHITARP
ncbi:MAG: 30S ribosomal protein S12 methylthiotransferase RimO [Nitratiruptor sp.]|nr:30S ribosomal protein S12 methylthiotransferase RimO [Nitratiruptor sp.]NPA83072.1 30S ribosomal protein S12 methylthiotransferase RimO [Campylobacterota bacterium]